MKCLQDSLNVLHACVALSALCGCQSRSSVLALYVKSGRDQKSSGSNQELQQDE